mmetsp:Transcript_34893/g.77555  ORF Transcript_34893/g.77555 Transcript_34893/m.77555 type:complete len:388 (-) Transcript_34893:1059-2222(-)
MAAPAVPAIITETVSKITDNFDKLSTGQKYAVAAAGGLTTLYLAKSLLASTGYKRKPNSFELSGGSISAENVAKEFNAYSDSYGKQAGEGIKDRSKTVHLVDVFYSLVTDMYEWGWGQSFHFSPKLPAKDWKQSEAAHEARIAATIGLKPGMKCLDCGCGVGGPMRTIAATSGAHVTGLTINEYQVSRAKYHNEKQGVSPLTTVVRGDFLNMPFPDNTFDGAYAIEATCHAPKLEEVYGEVFRVLKPGSIFVSYEWVSTNKFDPKNPEHVRIIDEINFGNGLPEMRTYKEAELAGVKVGFELVNSYDLAFASTVAGPWYDRLKKYQWMHHSNHAIVSTMDFLGLAPKGLKAVHKMLVDVAKSLVAGGETGVFTPMHFLVFRKPAAKK